jgi:hypothetical protein
MFVPVQTREGRYCTLATGGAKKESRHTPENPEFSIPTRSESHVQIEETRQGTKKAVVAISERKEGGQTDEETWG